ncbi:MAG: helix-turn-helix domain-containing protein [Treponema sp.]|nr:helix-turn-helix domain-containing protein [Treponema sp.]
MKDAIKKMESKMSAESVRRARIKAEQDIMAIRLAQLREERNVKQSEMANFTQSSVSKIEKRKDMKISTLIDYLDSLGMGLEIITYPKPELSRKRGRVLLKV